jgi:DeoR family transcriptional regulator, fructose operon transcriptional repressor
MGKANRQQNLVDLITRQGLMSVSDLAKQLSTSKMTIRRDLDDLDRSGLIKKVYGGAVFTNKEQEQPAFFDRRQAFQDEKSRIGEMAAKLICEDSIIFLDAGTTPFAIIKHLPFHRRFTVLTIGLMTAIALCELPNVSIIYIGGNVHPLSYSTMNYLAIDSIQRFHADLAFISAEAVSAKAGTFDSQLPLIEVKRAMVKASAKVVLLADHSKFEKISLCMSVPMDSIQTIITDSKISQESIIKMTALGKEVIIA